jgi:hypothetical protein
MHVSRQHGGVLSPTGKHYWGSVLFTAMVVRSVSLVFAAPYSPWSRHTFEHWDHASVANICRTLMETRLTFYYLCVDAVDDAQWNVRWNLFNLHDCCARAELMATLEHVESEDTLAAQAEEIRERLRQNAYFQSFDIRRQRDLLRGRKPHLKPLEEIAIQCGIDLKTFRMMWQITSSSVHSLPFSFYRLGEERARGVQTETEEHYTTLLFSFATVLLTGARDEFRTLMAGAASTEGPKPPAS